MSEHDIDVCSLDSQAEADALTELLADHGIDSLVISNHDTAFDGLWQAQIGWGRLRVCQEDAPQATDLVQQWRQAEPETEERRRRREKDQARAKER